MMYASAIILLIATMTSAEPPVPRGGYYARQQEQQNNNFGQSAPYAPRGFRPNGPAFNLPQRQQNLPPAPAASYGPPPQAYGPPIATTEVPTTTEVITDETTALPQTENLELQPKNDKLQANPSQPNLGALYVVVPQTQNLIYSAPATTSIATSSAKFVSGQSKVTSTRLIPIQAVPAFAKLVEQPVTYTKVVEQPSQLVYQQYQVAQAAPSVLAKFQEEPLLRYQTVAYASPDYSAAYVQRF